MMLWDASADDMSAGSRPRRDDGHDALRHARVKILVPNRPPARLRMFNQSRC